MYYEYQDMSDYFMGTNVFQKLRDRMRKFRAKKILKIGALSLIPGVGPIAASAAAIKMMKQRRTARLAAQKKRAVIKKVTEPNPVKSGETLEIVPVEKETPKPKTATWLIFGGLASAAMFLLGE